MKQCYTCEAEDTGDNFHANATICKKCSRARVRKSRYGIDADEQQRLHDEQEGRCAICNRHEDDLGRVLHVDHDHETGRVRGLLCDGCNQGLGRLQDDASLLRAAARYLGAGKFDVHNSGYIELVDAMASDLFVVNSARVSFNMTKQRLADGDEKLIDFLMRNRHGTPFESSVFTFRVKAPIFVIREWMRHRIGSFNEWSARYSKMEPDVYTPNRDAIRSQVGKPGAYTFERVEDDDVANTVMNSVRASQLESYQRYEDMLEQGIAKEVARVVLPVGIYSSMYWTVNGRSLMNFLSLRNSEHAQAEIRAYAKIIEEEMFAREMPHTYKSFVTNGRVAP